MSVSLEQLLERRPVNRNEVERIKVQMMTQVRASQLRELRQTQGFTQQQVAEIVGVSQRQISKIENGDIENSKLATIRRYLQAIGSELSLDAVVGDTRVRIA